MMSRGRFLIFANKFHIQCSKPSGKLALFDSLGILLNNLLFGPTLDLGGPVFLKNAREILFFFFKSTNFT